MGIRFALLCLFFHGTFSQSGSSFFRRNQRRMDTEEYCIDRGEEEHFRERLNSEAATEDEARRNCHVFYRCHSAGGGNKRITKFKCQSGMFFDIERQVCDIRRRVTNCMQSDKEKKPKPKWPLQPDEESSCADGSIECGSGECLSKFLFCDGIEDCQDGSDENICSPKTDPNRAPRCDPNKCLLGQGCFCSPDGTRIPGDLNPEQVPQMIVISFSGAVTEKSFSVYQDLFDGVTQEGNGCTPKATFFVSHAFTNYSAVQELHRKGHEIAVHSITNNGEADYWQDLSQEEFTEEFDGARVIIENFANISINDILGIRVPGGRSGGNKQIRMMNDTGFLYDASLAAPRGSTPIWPYTFEYRMPHKCMGIDQECPSQSFPLIWSMPLNEIDRRDDVFFRERLTGCHYLDSCSNIVSPEQFITVLDNNLNHHYSTNRAPFGLHFTAAYFESFPKLVKAFKNWIAEKASTGDYFIVNMQQVISWILEPEELSGINNFQLWKAKCDVQGFPYCSLPNPCSSRVPRLFPREDSMSLYTCKDCPNTYPWLYDPYGFGEYSFDDDYLKKK